MAISSWRQYLLDVEARFHAGLPSIFIIIGFLGTITCIYILFFTKYWIISALYIIWIIIDRDTCESEGRRNPILRKYFGLPIHQSYFPIKFKLASPYQLDANRNYMFCCFPHSIIPYGVAVIFASDHCGFKEYFPKHSYRIATLKQSFYIPLYRELLLEFGVCCSSSRALNNLLGQPKGGNAVAVVVGGAEESFYSNPGDYYIILQKRKGFIKLALMNGSPLVPVFTFGTNELFYQVRHPLLDSIQKWLKIKTGIAPILFCGRGLFHNWYGWVPLKKPVITIAGEPIEVQKTENPTQEQIEELHTKFTEAIKNLFNTQKHKYVENAEHVDLVII
ncbi:hypothetical protein FQA39_LY02307 [Lamprigera yunnana]|nr:hypothetical protein FQA39_LY02307 [Lamprigera yunnana]